MDDDDDDNIVMMMMIAGGSSMSSVLHKWQADAVDIYRYIYYIDLLLLWLAYTQHRSHMLLVLLMLGKG